MKFRSDIEAAINAAAAQTGMSPDRLRMMAWIESRGNPNAVNKLGYSGLFQMQPGEFARRGGQGSVLDPAENARVGAAWIKEKEDRFRAKYGRDPSDVEAYLLHQQGEGGLAAHLANPDAPAWSNMLSTGEGRQKGEAWARRAINGNGGNDTMTSRQFMDVWARKVDALKGMNAPSSTPVVAASSTPAATPGAVPTPAPAVPSIGGIVASAQPVPSAPTPGGWNPVGWDAETKPEDTPLGGLVRPDAAPANEDPTKGLTREQVEELIRDAQGGVLQPQMAQQRARAPQVASVPRVRFGLGGLA